MRPGTVGRRAGELPALQAATLCEAFQLTAAANADRVALRTPGGATELTFAEYAARVRAIAAGLHAFGVGRGDTVGVMLVNRPEFQLCDTAAFHLGATPFSIYNTSSPEQIAQLFANAGNRVVITEPQFVDAIRAANVDAVERVICLDDSPAGTTSFAALEHAEPAGFDFDAAWRAVSPDDVVTICYTSGTTGPPKGVQISHANVLADARAVTAVLGYAEGDRTTSYLPHAHLADRFSSHYMQMLTGMQLTCVADARAIAAALPDARPTVWLAVPRVWEKIKAALEASIAGEADDRRRHAAQWAIATGLQVVRAEQAGERIPALLRTEYEQADGLVLAEIRRRLGLDECRFALSGAAPAPLEVLEFFAALGIRICEGWGMSELTCAATINPPERLKLGTVGPALPGVELALADDGELLARGAMLMQGYRNDPERTAEAIDADGWMHTGDVAEIDEDGYVRIVDRKKELIINAAGKNMSPANIEGRLKTSSPLIGQAVAIGDRRPYNVALIVLDPDAAAQWAAEHGLEDGSPATVVDDPRIHDEVARGIAAANEHLSRVEQIKRFTILPDDWLPGGEELTPTMKLRRKPIAAKYAAEIEALYG